MGYYLIGLIILLLCIVIFIPAVRETFLPKAATGLPKAATGLPKAVTGLPKAAAAAMPKWCKNPASTSAADTCNVKPSTPSTNCVDKTADMATCDDTSCAINTGLPIADSRASGLNQGPDPVHIFSEY